MPILHSPSLFNLIMLTAWHEQGGNVLQRHLDSHPQLMVTPFESQLATPLSSNLLAGPNHWIPTRYAYPEFSTEMTSEAAYHAMWDEELKTYLRAPSRSKFRDCGLVMDEAARIAAFVKLCTPRSTETNDTVVHPCAPPHSGGRALYIEAFYRSTFAAWSNFARTGKETHYVGYSPPIGLEADKIIEDFPGVKIVHIVRNPWSGYADTKKRPFPMSLVRYCTLWNHVQLAAVTSAVKHPNHFRVIRYEDLVVQPRGVLNAVARWVGLEEFAEDAVIGPSFNRVPLTQVYPWGTIKTPTHEANVATMGELDKDETDAVSRETVVMMRQLYSDVLDGAARE